MIIIKLLNETENWSRGEFEAWQSEDAGLTLYEFGPSAEKRLGPWTEDELASLKITLEGKRMDTITLEIWGLVSLTVSEQQRTGAQCRCMALLKRINWGQEDFTIEWLALHRNKAMKCRETLRNTFADIPLPPAVTFATWHEVEIHPWSNELQAAPSTFIVDGIAEDEDTLFEQPFDEVEAVEENTNMTIASTGSAGTTRKRLVMSSDSEEDENAQNSRVSVQTVSTIDSQQHSAQLSSQMAPQDLYDFVVTRITRKYLDTSELLQKKSRDLELENRASDLQKEVSRFLSDLRKKHVIRETDNFLNGFDSQEANPDRPTHMRKAHFNKLRAKSSKESKALVKEYVNKAQELFNEVLKVEIVDVEEAEDTEEEEEDDGHHGRMERAANQQQKSDTERKRWIAQPAMDRDGEAVDVSRKRARRAVAAAPHHSSSIKRQLGLDVREENTDRRGKPVLSNLAAPERRAVRRDADYDHTFMVHDGHNAFYQDPTFSDAATEQSATRNPRVPREKFFAGSSRKLFTSHRSNAPAATNGHHHYDDTRYGRFLYRATETGFMKLPSNAELPSYTIHKPLLVRAPLLIFRNKELPSVVASLATPTSLTLDPSSFTPDPPVSVQQQPTFSLQRRPPQFKNLSDLADDFLNSSNGDLNAWGDLLNDWPCAAKADFDSLVRPVVTYVGGLPLSKRRCFMLKSMCQVTHCDRAIRTMLIFLVTYDYLESIYLAGEEEGNDQQMVDFLMEWDCKTWAVINAALDLLKAGRTRHSIATALLDQWESSNTMPDFDKLVPILLPQPCDVKMKSSAMLQWFEFCWETIWRFFPLMGGGEQSNNNNWVWITKSMLPSLPYWFHPPTAATEQKQGKMAKALRSLWHEHALPRDYIALIINRVVELNEHWTPCSVLTPLLFKACCNTNFEDISALIKLLRVELTKTPSLQGRIIDILNAANQCKPGFELQACELLIVLMVYSIEDTKAQPILSRIMTKFCELAPTNNTATARLIAEILPLACADEDLFDPQCELAKVMDRLVDVEASIELCWALAMRLEKQRGKLDGWQPTMLQLGRKLVHLPQAFFVFVYKLVCVFVAPQPQLCFDHKVVVNEQDDEDDDVLYGKEMALFEAKQQTLMTEEMLDLMVTTLPQLAQNCLLNDVHVQHAQQALEFSSWMAVVLGAKGYNVKPLLDALQTWPYSERNELIQAFDRFYFGVINASNQLGLACPNGYI